MITIEKLRQFGANTEEGLGRCLNEESFYLTLVESSLDMSPIDKLASQIAQNDLNGAFETAHALKGVYANLSLTPLLTPTQTMTESLRARQQIDYSGFLQDLRTKMQELIDLSQ